MAQTQIRGSSQIIDATITAAKFVASLNLPTSQLQDGAKFIQRDGSVAFTAAQSMGGFTLSNVADAVAAQDAVNLRTAQALVNGIAVKPSCKVVAVANLALTGAQTIDAVACVAGDRVLLTAQTVPSQNGIWVVAAGVWSRPNDYAAASAQKEGILIIVAEGTTYHDTKWLAITDGAITVDTTSTTWTQDMSGTVYAAGNGISLTGNTFAVKTGNGIAFDGSNNITVTANGTSLNVSASGVKVSDGTPGQVMLANAANAATFISLSGDVSITGAGVATVNSTAGSGFLKYAGIVGNETPGGLVNGANTAYTLASIPQSNSLELFLNGMLLEPGAGNDFTIVGTAITMLFAPLTGDKLRAYYTK
jgi:co-chaperonin GroES (HSP10)